ncbi:hypothetical protein TNCV_2504111 [Trichonephila clavipes]|nr:hypothetical protein TNCV_2504111 [Trichonephila clavipes]
MSDESSIAHRTRGAGSYEEAAIIGLCKICALDRLADRLPADTLRSTPTLHSPPAPCSPHGSPRVMESTRIDGHMGYCSILIEEDHTDMPPNEQPNHVLGTSSEVLKETTAPHPNTDLNVAWRTDSPPSMSHQPSGVLTVDELISPLPMDLNVTLSKSVSIQIEDEGEPLPPCTMVLQGDLQNLSMPRILEVPSPSGDGVQIRIEQTPPMTALKPSTPTNVSKTMSQPSTGPPGTPGISHGQSPPREQNSPSVLDIILRDDVIIDIEPDLIELTKKWGEKITGSPSKPAFIPPPMLRLPRMAPRSLRLATTRLRPAPIRLRPVQSYGSVRNVTKGVTRRRACTLTMRYARGKREPLTCGSRTQILPDREIQLFRRTEIKEGIGKIRSSP